MHYSTVALIPARAGSKRIPGKNIKTLGGHPLIAYAIQSAFDSGLFDEIYVSSDSARILEIALHYGALGITRPPEFATDTSADDEWIVDVFEQMNDYGVKLPHYYAIVRPTSPFRTGYMIKRAFSEWNKKSLMKAVEPVKQHPEKMWERIGYYMQPLYPGNNHFYPTQSLKIFYVQNASLEFRARFDAHPFYQPFFTEGYEGFDLNTPEDWILAEALIEKGYAKLPRIEKEPYDFTAV